VAANKRPLLIEADAQNTLSDEFINDIGGGQPYDIHVVHVRKPEKAKAGGTVYFTRYRHAPLTGSFAARPEQAPKC